MPNTEISEEGETDDNKIKKCLKSSVTLKSGNALYCSCQKLLSSCRLFRTPV